jgi:hypothetical protein
MGYAHEVDAFLIHSCNVPVRRVVRVGRHGTAARVASNQTRTLTDGRVEVKFLANREREGRL